MGREDDDSQALHAFSVGTGPINVGIQPKQAHQRIVAVVGHLKLEGDGTCYEVDWLASRRLWMEMSVSDCNQGQRTKVLRDAVRTLLLRCEWNRVGESRLGREEPSRWSGAFGSTKREECS